MFTSKLLDAICQTQRSIGGQMAMNAISAKNVALLLVVLSNKWAGDPIPEKFDPSQDGQQVIPLKKDGSSLLPLPDYLYSVTQVQFMVTWLAGKMKDAKGDDLTKLQSQSSAWTNIGQGMNSLADLQKSPINTTQQGENSQIQQDQSGISGLNSLASPLADTDSIVANLLPNIS